MINHRECNCFWRDLLEDVLLWVATLCLCFALLGATTDARAPPATVFYFYVAQFAIGIEAYATVARCTATGGCGTVRVPLPLYPMLWLLTAAVLGPIDVLVFGFGDRVCENVYWLIKLTVLIAARVCCAAVHHERLQRAVAHSQLPPNALRHVCVCGGAGGHTEWQRPCWWSPELEQWRQGVIAEYRQQSAQQIQQFVADYAHLLDEVMATMQLHVYTHTLPATLFQCQWSSLRSLQLAAVSFTMPASTMAALIHATPNLYELTMSGCNAGTQFAADWVLTDGWRELRRLTMHNCDKALCHSVILQTRQLTHATLTNITNANPPLLRELVRRNGGTLAHFSTSAFGMGPLELLAQCARLRHIIVDCTGFSTFTCHRLATLIQSIVSLSVVSLHVNHIPNHIALTPGSLNHLTALMLTCARIPSDTLRSILQAAPNVHSLQLSMARSGIGTGTLNDTLRSIVNSVPFLSKLRLWNIDTMNDGVLRTIATALPQLTHLWLRYNNILEEDNDETGPWATVHHVPQSMLTHIELIRLDRTRAHISAEFASVESLRTALRALVSRSLSAADRIGGAVVVFDNAIVRPADCTRHCQWPPPEWTNAQIAMLPDSRPDILGELCGGDTYSRDTQPIATY